MINIQVISIAILVLIFSENIISINLKSKWRNLRKKTKHILEENWNKTRGISQVGPKPGSYLDYPGKDIEKINKNKQLWDLYYKCLEELIKSINENNIFQAKVITTFRSSSLRLIKLLL